MGEKTTHLELSVIITAHHEGVIAHKTILSLSRALKPFDDDHIPYEIVVHIDNGDKATLDYFASYEKDPRYRILKNSFGNPAESRNFAVRSAAGTYAALIDGDDLVSPNWLIDGYRSLKRHEKPVIMRPNYQIQFGGREPQDNIWLLEDSFSKEEDALIMSHWNRWPNALIAPTQTLQNIPFKPTVSGFGYEDWLFNCDTRAANIPNLVIPGSTLFYRRRDNSVSSEHIGGILPYTELFNADYIKAIKLPPVEKKRDNKLAKIKHGCKRIIIDIVKQTPPLRRLASPLAQKILYKKQLRRLPKALIDTWKDINSIEAQAYPTKEAIVRARFHPLSFNQHNAEYGTVYKRLLDQVSGKPDYLFFIPSMSTGGTEKLLFNYIYAILKAHPEWHIVVLSALPKKHHYAVPENVDFVDFDGTTKGIGGYEKSVIWSRFLIQLGVKRLHIINHDDWYRWLAEHKTLLGKNGYIVNASMFMREYTHEKGRIRSYAEPFLNDIYPIVNKVFTDNQTIIDETLATNAFDPEKFIVHYQPGPADVVNPKDINTDRPLRILWASRLSHQKRPDILKKIAENLDPKKFHIDAYGRGQHYNKQYFKGLKSLSYKGPFSGIHTIPTEEYDLYLYTSDVDGLPNILLEIAATGLPIVASNDGGVGEFVINDKTGLLVPIEDIAGYLRAFEDIRANPAKAKKLAEAAQTLLLSRHSIEKFDKVVKRDIQ